jgi:hypothetical protein
MIARGAAASTVGVLGSPRAVRSNDVGGDPRIKHIVVLMMENRSFDHMFGLLMSEIPGLRGVREGEWTNVDDRGNVHALTADAAYQGQLRVDPPHDFWSVNDQSSPTGTAGARPPRPDGSPQTPASGRQSGQHHECFSGPGAGHPRPGQELPLIATTGSPRCRLDESQPRLRALRDVLRPGRQRPDSGSWRSTGLNTASAVAPQSRPDGQDLQRAERRSG